MKKILLIITLIFIITLAKAQSFEVSVQANGGLSGYFGNSTVSATNLNVDNATNHTGYPNGTGNVLAFSYGADIQWQYTFKSRFILGLQTGYEILASKVDINGVYDGNGSGETSATGYAEDHDGFINISPYIGYRFNLHKVRLDVLPGFDLAFGVNSWHTVNVTASDNTYYNKHTDNIYGNPDNDVRVRLGLAAYYQKFGITASYSRGLTNFNSGALADGPVPPLYRQVFRLGLSYRIK